MSIKITGTPVFHPGTDQSKRVKKSGVDFDETLKKSEAPKANENADSVKLTGNLNIPQGGYQPPVNTTSAMNPQDSIQAEVKALSSQVLSSEVEANQRVQEIKDLIEKGGAKSYLDSIDSEKVAERLLNSGLLDDIV